MLTNRVKCPDVGALSDDGTACGDDPASSRQLGTAALASNQRRVRGLQHVRAYNLPPLVAPSVGYEFTLAVPFRSSTVPIYSSELSLSSDCAEWEPLVLPTVNTAPVQTVRLLASGTLLVRVFASGVRDTPRLVWLVHLASLVPVRPQLRFAACTLLFCHRGQWLTSADCVLGSQLMQVPHHVTVPSESVASAATAAQLERLHRCQHERHRLERVLQRLQQLAADGCRQLQPTRRRAASLHGQRRRLMLLRQLVTQARARVQQHHVQLSSCCDRLQERRRQLVEAGACLVEERNALALWRHRSWQVLAAVFAKQRLQLHERRRQLLAAVGTMFELDTGRRDVAVAASRSDISTVKDGPLSILGISLPDADHLAVSNSAEARVITVALSHVAHTVRMCAWIVGACLRYPIEWRCGQVVLSDHVLSGLLNSERQFVLAPGPSGGAGANAGELCPFQYGVYLLSKNVAQLCAYCRLDSPILPAVLLNLCALVSNGVSCDVDRQMSLRSSLADSASDIDSLSTAFDSPPALNRRVLLGFHVKSPTQSSSIATFHSSTDSSSRSTFEEVPIIPAASQSPGEVKQPDSFQSGSSVGASDILLVKSSDTTVPESFQSESSAGASDLLTTKTANEDAAASERAVSSGTNSSRDNHNQLICDQEWNRVTSRMETLVGPKSFKLLSKRV